MLIGTGVSGATLLLRLTCANYYGRQNLGSITGLILSVQTAGQAMGPVVAGFIFDITGSYWASFLFFAIIASLSGILALSAPNPTLQATHKTRRRLRDYLKPWRTTQLVIPAQAGNP